MHTFSLPAVNVVARSLIPLAGIVLLGWSAANLLVVVFMALQLAVLFGTRGAGFVLVLAYAAATVALELYPNAVMRAFHAPDLADDGGASGRASPAPERRPAPPAQRNRFSHRIEE